MVEPIFCPLPLVLIPFIRDSWDSKLPQVTINYFEVRCTHFMALLYIHLPRCKWEVKVNFGEFPTKNIISIPPGGDQIPPGGDQNWQL